MRYKIKNTNDAYGDTGPWEIEADSASEAITLFVDECEAEGLLRTLGITRDELAQSLRVVGEND